MRSPNRQLENRCDKCTHSLTLAASGMSRLRKGARLCPACYAEEALVALTISRWPERVRPDWTSWVEHGLALP